MEIWFPAEGILHREEGQVGVGNGSEVPGEWDSSGPGEPPAQLLRRAISHVESLLQRLETGEKSETAPAALPPSESGGGPAQRAPDSETTQPPAPSSTPAASDERTDERAGDNVVELGRASSADGKSEYVPLSGVSSTAQAEALRITLHAHEEAHRLRAEANGLRAEAAAEGERILVEARMLSDRLHVESRDSATELLAAAKNEATAIIDAARAEAERMLREAHEDSAAHRAELDAEAERERAGAATATLAEARREADKIRADARNEADKARNDALEEGRAEVARLVEVEVAVAAAEGRRTVEASRVRAAELLDAANDSIEDVRKTMRRLIESLGEAMVDFNTSIGPVEVLRDAIGELAPPQPEPAPEAEAEALASRRPLGLLFGARAAEPGSLSAGGS